jgi:tetratricopeptide (TPR) repeat protein
MRASPPETPVANVTVDMRALEALFHRGVGEHRAGRLDAAEACYRGVLAQQPRQFDTLHLLGLLRLQRDDPVDAEAYLRAAAALSPGIAIVHLNLGKALCGQQRHAEAIGALSRALQLDPELAGAAALLAQSLEAEGRFAEALAAHDRALARDGTVPSMLGRARCLVALGQGHAAIAQLRLAIARAPGAADAHLQLAEALARAGDPRAALVAVEQTLQIESANNRALALRGSVLAALVPPALDDTGQASRDAQVLHERSRAMTSLGRLPEAQALLEEALRLDGGHYGARADLLAVLVAGGSTQHAGRARRLADQLRAEQPRDARNWFNRALLSYNLGEYALARREFRVAVDCDPDGRIGRFNLGLLDLLEGNYASGWVGHEYRWDDPAAGLQRREFTQPLWTGNEPMAARTLLVHAEQVLGDTLQFCRYVPRLLPLAGVVVLEVAQPLCALMRRWLPAQVTVVERDRPLPPFDFQCPLLSLPHAFATDTGSIPPPLPGLGASPQGIAMWEGRLRSRVALRVGLAWSGNADHANDHQRSLPLAALAPLLTGMRGRGTVEFVSLQNQLRRDDRAVLAQYPELQYFGEAIEDFESAAALTAICDCVVTVDTAALHLAASMGKPVMALLPYVPDWRWGLDTATSEWYPGLRLFRQGPDRAWEPVISAVAQALADMPARNRGGCAW